MSKFFEGAFFEIVRPVLEQNPKGPEKDLKNHKPPDETQRPHSRSSNVKAGSPSNRFG